jgi:prepilin-type N-terminal cleavage/methylation domain-containing protein
MSKKILKKLVKRGFTLIELLVVVTIIGILAGLAVPGINKALNSAKQAADISNAKQLGTVLFAVANDDNGNYPGYASDPVSDRQSAASTTTLFGSLLKNGDLTDPKILVSNGGKTTVYTGALSNATSGLQAANVGWDYVTNLTTTSNSLLPLIITKGAVSGNPTVFTSDITPGANNIWGDNGFAVYTVGNSAAFLKTKNSGGAKKVSALVNAQDFTSSGSSTIITAQ